MIVTPESQYKSPVVTCPSTSGATSSDLLSRDPPPSYSPSPATIPVLYVPQQQPPTKSANYLSLVRNNGSIKGTYTVDPRLYIPTSLLPPLCPGESEADRTNLRLESKNGTIDADIWLVGGERQEMSEDDVLKKNPRKKRTSLVLSTFNGSVTAKVHTSTGPSFTPTPFRLTATCYNGSITIFLPRSFQGVLSLSTRNGSTSISDALSERTTTFSEVDSTRKCFVGDFTDDYGEEGWNGDEVVLEAKNGSMKVRYVDEARSRDEGKGGFFSRMFWC